MLSEKILFGELRQGPTSPSTSRAPARRRSTFLTSEPKPDSTPDAAALARRDGRARAPQRHEPSERRAVKRRAGHGPRH